MLPPYVWPILRVHPKKLTGEGGWNNMEVVTTFKPKWSHNLVLAVV